MTHNAMTAYDTPNSTSIDPKNRKKLAWREAATGGLNLGLTLIAIMVISYYLGHKNASLSWVSGLLNFVALVFFSFYYARRVSCYYLATGFSYPQSLAFILKMMLFTGVLAGIGQFVLLNYLDPDYYTQMIETMLRESKVKEEDISLAMEAGAMRNPIVMVLSGVIGMMLYGGMIGLVVSVFVKRPPITPPSDQNPNSFNSQQ